MDFSKDAMWPAFSAALNAFFDPSTANNTFLNILTPPMIYFDVKSWTI